MRNDDPELCREGPTMISWMAYAALVGAIVAVGGLAMERLAAAMGRPRRIAWLAALTLAIVIPLTGGWGSPVAVPVVESEAPGAMVIGGASIEGFWSAVPTLPVPGGKSTGRIALLVWGAGSLAALAFLASVLVLVARGRRRWERRRVRGTDVYVSRRFGPALVGVARPEVVVPAWVLELEPGARDAIIRHEVEHARAKDHVALLHGGLAAVAFPWSPAIWWMYRRLRAAVELDCDQRVLASGIGVADYGDVLLNAGSRSRGRWGFAPAMGQPESLLERRLKTMSEKRKKLNGGYAALLAAVAVGAVVAACDTPVPTEVREAFEEVMAEEEAQGTDAEGRDWVERFLQAKAFGPQTAPLLYVDGIRIRKTEDLPESARGWLEDPDSASAEIDRIEILKGPAAMLHYGEEAAGGVIQIFTEDAEAEAEVIVVPAPEIESVIKTELIDGARARAIVVSGIAGQKPKVEEIGIASAGELSIRRARVTGLASQWDAMRSEMPVIYIDGVRVDGDASGMNRVLATLAPEQIDRIEVMKGDAARKEFGEEAAHGVIQIFTKKGSPDGPVPEAGKGGEPSAKRSPAGSG
ncbi:MAG: TonB-dependent receptor plug domain-containing protein [Gemmatimonadetes bacterium]|nr:TonB-dependent receptor plug domain-containing protein [Gemmatimonadota bacterium]MYB97625.1 TonB-dependent receptor plug domain-containing protein [Gemmatimonadota bacterium]MYI45375.1 TonB-dependent receptor plug domain-containing protein [Gemmatimonadota bacterium]